MGHTPTTKYQKICAGQNVKRSRSSRQLAVGVEQDDEPRDDVKRVGSDEEVEEAAQLPGGERQPLADQRDPLGSLKHDEEAAEGDREQQEALGVGVPTFLNARLAKYSATPLASSAAVLRAVSSMGRRGCPGGGHPPMALLLPMTKALIRPEKNMTSVATKISMPSTPFGRTGSRLAGTPKGDLVHHQA